ncbi:14-3-3 domain-containing protein [Podospora aff. communis PSN243]|uniref:14-3-3 domain-containing protein n=1 Tax=Podospora aff. communis PSN243 TaxID=3040156 RepID=A0AAV9GK30_9PEZI|nr:14-3-3 domain-containing protein [Podospora aff. communis PSN243]
MASSEVDQKFLGKLAKAVENENPLLASILFKILGLSINLSNQLIKARKLRRHGAPETPESLELTFHIIWLSREGLVLLNQYVLPMVGEYVELKVLAYKLRASFYHIYVLFHNTPPVSTMSVSTPEGQTSSSVPSITPARVDKGKGVATEDDDHQTPQPSGQPIRSFEGGPVGPPPGFGTEALEPPTAFLLEPGDYLPKAHRCFQEAVQLAEELLWGSHSLRLSVKTEYAAFLYECVHDREASRKVAQTTITEVFDSTEGIADDMFVDSSALVDVLGKMMKRGLGSSNTLRSKAQGSSSGTQGTPRTDYATITEATTHAPPPGMI